LTDNLIGFLGNIPAKLAISKLQLHSTGYFIRKLYPQSKCNFRCTGRKKGFLIITVMKKVCYNFKEVLTLLSEFGMVFEALMLYITT